MINDILSLFGAMSASSPTSAAWNQASVDSTARRQGINQADASQLEARLDHLTLVCMAMWSLLSEKSNLTPGDLLERIRQIDLADGKADGKLTRTIRTCHKCNRVMSPRHSKCLYCGSKDLSDPFAGAM